jgi:hypothetical protein
MTANLGDRKESVEGVSRGELKNWEEDEDLYSESES